MVICGMFLIVPGIYSAIYIFRNRNPFNIYKTQMIGFSLFFIIALFAITSNPCNTIDEIDSKYDLGTGSYTIAKEFDIKNLPEDVEIFACDLSPLWISYPLIAERKINFIDEEDVNDIAEILPEKYLIIGKDRLPDIPGEKIYNHPLFTGKKHKFVFIRNY